MKIISSKRNYADTKSFEGYVYSICDNCGYRNRIKVAFPEFNKPFEDRDYRCENCGAVIELTDLHTYDEDGYIVESSKLSKLDIIKRKLVDVVHKMLTSSEFGFDADEVDSYSEVEIYPVEIDCTCIEIRAEVSYDGLWQLKQACDPIIEKYYPDAYFDMVDSGILQTFIEDPKSISSASNETYFMQLKRNYKNMRKFDDMTSDSAHILDFEDELKAHNAKFERYEHKSDNGCTIFYDDYVKGANFNNSDLTEYTKIRYGSKQFAVHYTYVNSKDPQQAFNKFKASISMITPYDDADYYWARLHNGVIEYIYKGNVVKTGYYLNPEDMLDVDDQDLSDWYNVICDQAVQTLYEANKSIESKMIHN